MATEYNRPNHRYYQKRYHVKLAVQDICKQFIYASGIKRIDNEVIRVPLFSLSEPGVWYDPSDLTTLFQDTAGTTPVTTPGQTVALALDKSKGLVLGPELVTNGDFSNGVTGWSTLNGTGAVSGGVYTFTPSANFGGPRQNITLVTGRSYQITATISGNASARVYVNNTSGPTTVVAGTAASRTISFIALATATSGEFVVDSGNNTTPFTIDNISVRELPGFHATQATAASRPTYGIVPSTGRRNLLTWTEQFDNAAWVKANSTVTANAGTAPDGTMTADRLVDNTSAVVHAANQTIAVTSNTTYTLSFYAKASGRNWVTLDPVYPSVANNITYFDLANGAVGTSDPDNSNVTIIAVGDGWYRCSLRHTTAVGQTSMIFQIAPANANNGISYIGSGADGVLIWGAQLETGSSATSYQKVTTAFDVTEAGVPSLHYLSFDGVDDFLVTPTITPGTDKAQVFAGVRKLSDAGTNNLVSFGNPFGNVAGTFSIDASNVAERLRITARGTAQATATTTNAAYSAPVTGVYTTQLDIAGDNTSGRWNGSSALSSSGDLGTGNFTAQAFNVGRYGGTSSPFNGNIFSLIVRFGANLDAGTITSTETWVNGKTGAYA